MSDATDASTVMPLTSTDGKVKRTKVSKEPKVKAPKVAKVAKEPKVKAPKVKAPKVAKETKAATKAATKAKVAAAADEAAAAAAAAAAPRMSASERLVAKRGLYREKWLKTLQSLITAAPSAGEIPLDQLAVYLERGAFNHAITAARKKRLLIHPGCPAFWQLYVARTCTLWRNLRNSPDLLRSVHSSAITAQDLEAMSAVELDLEHWRAELDAKSKRDASRIQTRLASNTTMYKCKECGSKQCSYFEIQIRGSDEPSTVFITCIDCSFRWKDE